MKADPAGPAPAPGTAGLPVSSSCVPIIPHTVPVPARENHQKRHSPRMVSWRDHTLNRDTFFEVRHGDACHIISEDYSYKTESYYTILRHELEGTNVCPSSGAVLDAYVVPICLERAHLAGIPVCDWGISQGYVPLPSVIYGLNYFANTSEYRIVSSEEDAKEAIKHITNMGKYPFCYQKLPENAGIETCTAIFGKTAGKCKKIGALAEKVYNLFRIPLVTIVTITDGDTPRLSSLCSTRYTHLTPDERALLMAYLNHQEFL